jgi:signal transduction histidine kinase
MRSGGAWGWLAAGLLLTASLMLYLLRQRGRTEAIEALVAERTAALEQTSAQLQQAQKMEAIGNLTGGMAHDFNNLLTVVVGNLDVLRDAIADNPRASALADAAMRAAIRGAELIRRLLAFARRQPLAPKLIDVGELVLGMTELLRRTLGEHIEIAVAGGHGLWPVMIDPAQLDAAIVNLATNARDAMPKGGRLTVETRNARLDADYVALNPEAVPGDYVLVEVSDNGGGMTPEILVKAFEPFFTTKDVGEGSGLGLSMVFGFVKQSEGHIKIYSEPGEGTTVRIYLPRAARPAEATATGASSPPAPRGRETILVVEDNEDVRNVVVRQLADLGYTALAAANPRAALAILKDPAAKIDLLFTDLIMPGGMSGHDLAHAAVAHRPGLAVLFTSGYPGNSLRNGDRIKDGEHFLGKPYRRDDLARKLREIFRR